MTKEQYEQRLETCKACPVYNQNYGTCGQPTDAINPFKKAVELDGVTFKPCGCAVEHKAAYAVSQCPANRWAELPKKTLVDEALDFIGTIKKRGRLVPGEMAKIYQMRKEILGINDGKMGTSCPPCLEEIVNKLEKKLMEEIKTQESTVVAVTKKKTIKRTKTKKGGTNDNN
jgi:hypothetical protein